MIKRLWKFSVETDIYSGYLLSSGEIVRDKCDAPSWIGTDAEANTEAVRRAQLSDDRAGPRVDRVVYESQGRVKSNAKTDQEEMPF